MSVLCKSSTVTPDEAEYKCSSKSQDIPKHKRGGQDPVDISSPVESITCIMRVDVMSQFFDE